MVLSDWTELGGLNRTIENVIIFYYFVCELMQNCNIDSSSISGAWPFWVFALHHKIGFPESVYILIVLYPSSHSKILTNRMDHLWMIL